jgi:3-methyl-2-oxobutanoate hydroxymethyltransferase
MFDDFVPKFVKRYANVKEMIKNGAEKYIEEVKGELFPDEGHSFLK